jgi:small subunit ribosomal protein S4
MSTKLLLKFKSSRSLSENIWPTRKITSKQKFILSKLRRKKISFFGSQLIARRALSILYGKLSYSQYNKTREEASKLQGKIGNNFISLLEKRLDTIVYRMNICSTFRAAQQLILHQKVFVNNKLINIPSYQLEPGDIVSISPKNQESFQALAEQALKNLKENRICKVKSLHLEVDYKTLNAIFLYPPQQLFHSYKLDINLLTQ